MNISLFFAWVTVFLAIITMLKYVARISKSVKANRFFHKIHIPAGVLMVFTGLLHGLLAGNFGDTKLSEARIGVALFSFNWGTICFVVSVLLGLSYLIRKRLKKNWMKVHRILTVCLLVCLMLHVVEVGIQLSN
ncbi:MAG: hypothetical protein ACI4S2_12770 [Lachnospiraceae bacterium]